MAWNFRVPVDGLLRRDWFPLVVTLCLLAGALVYEAGRLGLTVDEPSHLLSASLWWHGRDRLYPRDMPPLIKAVGGWPAALMDLPLPPDLGKQGDTRQEWSEAATLFSRLSPAAIDKLLFRCRLPLIIFPLLVTTLLWLWSRDLFGPRVATCTAALWALCPTALGHGALFKNDLAATFTYLLFWYTVWRFWRKPGWPLALAVGAASGFVILSKMSMLFVPVLAPFILAARGWRRSWLSAVLWPAASILLVWMLAAAAWQFDMYSPTATEIAKLQVERDIPQWFASISGVFRFVPIPASTWTGVISLLKVDSNPVPVYMLGQVYPRGHHLYFVLATFLKLALPTLLLILGTIPLLFIRRRKLTVVDAFWLLPGVLYFSLASMASLHLGVRLVLPAWAFFFLAAGVSIEWILAKAHGKLTMAVTVASVVVLTALAYPFGIAYFNPFVGGNANALRYLADSNIDWGQSLGEVARYARANRIEKIRLSYFGFDRPDRYFANGQYEPLIAPWNANVPERVVPARGWYAISASLLPGQFFLPRYRDYYAAFRQRQPTAIAGGSIFIYRID